MDYKYQHQHKAEAILITCIDFRFHQATIQYVSEELGLKDFDLLTVPGVAKNLAEGNVSGKEIIRIIKEVSRPLHQIKKIVVMNHWDCGGYGGSKSFASEKDEEEKYKSDLQKAKTILNKEFSELETIIGYSKVKNDQLVFKMIE
ncbi:hypothetical protein KJ840_04270 [Patescibacteria group bacterium]|nr:hypothetical protein [Patescibacteria group bacterium]